MSSSLSLTRLIRETTPERHTKATDGLSTGELTVRITNHTDHELRALVRNGDGSYGVCITEHGGFCGCPDFAWRGVTCKHLCGVALFTLQQAEAEKPHFHLTWSEGLPLCGAEPSVRMWVYPQWGGSMLAWPEACPNCVATYQHPLKAAA